MFVRATCATIDAKSDQMTTRVENTYRDFAIGFANALSMIADEIGLDVWHVFRLANRHPRANILQPGPGVS